MAYRIEKKDSDTVLSIIQDLDHLLEDRIVDLHELKGGQQARHAYMLYRTKVWEIRDALLNSLKPIKTKNND